MNLEELSEHLADMTPHQIKILQALYDSGDDWLTRAKVAKAIGKRRLTPYDIDCLTMFSEKGIVELGKQPTKAPGSDFAYIYHVSDEVSELIYEWAQQQSRIFNSPKRKPLNFT